MSDPTMPVIDPRAYIRTYVPLGVGALLGLLISRYTVVADAIAWLDANLSTVFPGFDWREFLNTLAVAGVTAFYYWAARQIGRRFPKVEAWLLGSSAVPTYAKR